MVERIYLKPEITNYLIMSVEQWNTIILMSIGLIFNKLIVLIVRNNKNSAEIKLVGKHKFTCFILEQMILVQTGSERE